MSCLVRDMRGRPLAENQVKPMRIKEKKMVEFDLSRGYTLFVLVFVKYYILTEFHISNSKIPIIVNIIVPTTELRMAFGVFGLG